MSARGTADTLWINGQVLTVDAQFQVAQAVAIQGNHICAVGSTSALQSWVGEHTQVVDLKGKTVVPGLIDGHAHLDREGLRHAFPSLGPITCIADIQAAIARLAAQTPKGEWIVTMPLEQPPSYQDIRSVLREGRLPTREELDAAAPDHPVYIRSIWGFWRHTTPLVSMANSRALQLAGIDRHTPVPSPLVEIEKNAQGEPTGRFFENTLMPIVELAFFNQATQFSHQARVETMPHAVQAYQAFGTTSVFEGHGAAAELVKAYREAHESGALQMRACLVMSPHWSVVPDIPLDLFVQSWCAGLAGAGMGDDFLRLGGLYVDLGPDPSNDLRARAYPHTGWAGFNYDTARQRDRALELLKACARHGVRVVAIWPNMLELFYAVHQEIPLNGLRWVLGHIALLTPQHVEWVREMGLIVTTHTNRYVYKEGPQLLEKVGAERAHEIVPLRALVDAGVPVVLATDNVPVSLFHPFWHAVARQARDGTTTVAAHQALTREEALRAITANGALLSWDEGRKGTIEVGKLADLAVLDRDILTCPAESLPGTRSLLTMVDGRITHRSADFG